MVREMTYWSLALDTRRVSYSESLETHVDDLECQLSQAKHLDSDGCWMDIPP